MPFMKYGNAPETMVHAFQQNVMIARERNEVTIIEVTNHAHIFGRPRGAYFYEKIIEQAASSPDIWVATRAQVADHVLSLAG